MKIFQLLRKYLAILGVEPLQPIEKNQRIEMYLKRMQLLVLCIQWVICLTVFIGCEAKTIDEYTDAIYISSCVTTILCTFPIIIWKIDNLFKLIEDFEDLIRQRKTTEFRYYQKQDLKSFMK